MNEYVNVKFNADTYGKMKKFMHDLDNWVNSLNASIYPTILPFKKPKIVKKSSRFPAKHRFAKTCRLILSFLV